jgi:tRNA(adenine34) deaminase
MKTDLYYIQRCEILGKKAATKGDAPVGAVITKDDEIISEAIEVAKNKNDVTCHAELEAIRFAVKKLQTNACGKIFRRGFFFNAIAAR